MEPVTTFEKFNQGSLAMPQYSKEFSHMEWTKHPVYEGVELKHIITGNDTQGDFSYHLVRIAPCKSIQLHVHEKQLETHEVIEGSGSCINEDKQINYYPGVISIMKKGIPHEVTAGPDGLFLFAKFIPALC